MNDSNGRCADHNIFIFVINFLFSMIGMMIVNNREANINAIINHKIAGIVTKLPFNNLNLYLFIMTLSHLFPKLDLSMTT